VLALNEMEVLAQFIHKIDAQFETAIEKAKGSFRLGIN
jgi:hypothetical protein